MSDFVNEQLSACLDGELPSEELDLLLKRIGRDPEIRRTAARYSLIGSAIREQRGPLPSVDFAARVAQAIATDQPSLPRARPAASRFDARRWVRPAVSAALVAGIAVLSILILNRPDPGTPQPVADSAEPAPVAAPVLVAPRTHTTPVGWPAERLANYVVAHSEYSSPLSRPMVLNSLLVEQSVEERVADEPDMQPTVQPSPEP
jgi:anti-sigma factor RsiW